MERLQHQIGQGMRRRVAEHGLELRGSEARILDLIEPDGTRPSELAEGAWISKQAIGKRISDMGARGLVTIRPDPGDGRAVLVSPTEEGERVHSLVIGQIADLEREFSERVGADRYGVFRDVLDELVAPTSPGKG